jgi:NTE family protein
MSQTFPFKNLVFKGGGVKGVAYLGAIEVLEQQGVLPSITRVAGSSAGAITAMALSFPLTAAQVIDLVNTLDFSRIAGGGTNDIPFVPEILKKELAKIFGEVDSILRLLFRYGLHTSDYFYDWLKQTIAAQCGGNAMATFRDFQERGFRDLHVTSADISQHVTRYFSAALTPDVAVADAVRMSMSLPFFFVPQRFDGTTMGQGDYMVDGGTQNNYPISLFDGPAYQGGHGYLNWETLGFFLYTAQENIKPAKIESLPQYIENMVETLLAAQDVLMRASEGDVLRTVMVSDCGVATTDFNIKPGDPTYNKLVESGRQATHAYLSSYKPLGM